VPFSVQETKEHGVATAVSPEPLSLQNTRGAHELPCVDSLWPIQTPKLGKSPV